jgi:hypothetical protein
VPASEPQSTVATLVVRYRHAQKERSSHPAALVLRSDGTGTAMWPEVKDK